MGELNNKLKREGIELVFLELESPGYYDGSYKIMFINQNQSDEDIKKVIYHELKHAIDHDDYVVLYKKVVPFLKLESEANDYMVRKIIEEHGGVYNYTRLIEEFKIGMGNDVKFAE